MVEFNSDIKFNRTGTPKANDFKNVKSGGSNDIEIGQLLGASNKAQHASLEEFAKFGMKYGHLENLEPTQEELAAKAQLNEKTSSTGMSYADADARINDIREKYNSEEYMSEVESKQPEGRMVYITPHKEFDPSKLPEPARTEYGEAMASKNEIENNNAALAKKAGIPVSEKTKSTQAPADNRFNALLEKFGLKPKEKELSEKQKAAIAKLDDKQSSTGVTYKDASDIITKLTEKYGNDKQCQSKFESKQPENISIYIAPYEAFDPYKIPEPDKSAYFEALESVMEIEDANSALLQQTGLNPTAMPSQNYSDNFTTSELSEKLKELE